MYKSLQMKFSPYFLLCFAVTLMSVCSLQAQKGTFNYNDLEGDDERYNFYNFTIGLGYEIPGGELSDRFGPNMKFSLGGEYLTGKGYFFGAEFDLKFGNDVKEDVLSTLRLDNGFIIGSNGGLTDIFLRERGFFLGGLFGRVIPTGESQSGIRLGLGIGVLSHNVRILNEDELVVQVDGNYLKGYDRLTRGFALKQQLGYDIHSKDGRLNMNIAFEITEGFTKSVRGYQFDIGSVADKTRLDLLYGIKATWLLPIKRIATSDKQIYY